VDGIFQTAFVVPDLRAAIDRYVADAGVGPWFLLDRLDSAQGTYRGGPSRSAITLAMAFSGGLQIELIQPLDEEPSVYKELIDARGYGFHHFGKVVTDLDRAAERLHARGYEEVFRLPVPTGGDVVYFDANGDLPGFLEIFEGTPGMEEVFTRFHLASVGWRGDEPVRSFL
jgi:hypothetical protein